MSCAGRRRRRPRCWSSLRSPAHDPIDEADRRESLRRLIADVRRLPEQQRSALLMRELGGMSYADMAGALGVTVPAVKSLLVRARLALGQALEARDTACSEIREELIVSHDRGLRPNATARRHMRDCAGCREFRHQLRGVSRRFAAIVPTLGPLGVLANVLGVGGAGSGAAGGALAAGAGGAAGTGSAVVGVGAMSAGATHVATLARRRGGDRRRSGRAPAHDHGPGVPPSSPRAGGAGRAGELITWRRRRTPRSPTRASARPRKPRRRRSRRRAHAASRSRPVTAATASPIPTTVTTSTTTVTAADQSRSRRPPEARRR